MSLSFGSNVYLLDVLTSDQSEFSNFSPVCVGTVACPVCSRVCLLYFESNCHRHGPRSMSLHVLCAGMSVMGDSSEDALKSAKRARTSTGDAAVVSAQDMVEGQSQVDEYESAEAWAAWEEEMKQYDGWEQGEGEGVVAARKVKQGVDASDPSSVAKDELTCQLLEDMETRVSILTTMAEAGVCVCAPCIGISYEYAHTHKHTYAHTNADTR